MYKLTQQDALLKDNNYYGKDDNSNNDGMRDWV
jgi:hypothetical protein